MRRIDHSTDRVREISFQADDFLAAPADDDDGDAIILIPLIESRLDCFDLEYYPGHFMAGSDHFEILARRGTTGSSVSRWNMHGFTAVWPRGRLDISFSYLSCSRRKNQDLAQARCSKLRGGFCALSPFSYTDTSSIHWRPTALVT